MRTTWNDGLEHDMSLHLTDRCEGYLEMSNPILALTETIRVGQEVILESDNDTHPHGVVFEDDGETGYFYARDYSVTDQLFVDALHIYTVGGVADQDLPSTVQILWSFDGRFAALIINQYPHAVFDFRDKCGYSRDNFPDPDPATGWTHEPWDDKLRTMFFG